METETGTETEATRERAQGAGESAPAPVEEIFVTVSDALEYLFCPRFIFFERCLMIPEHQEKRYKVMKGRELHEILMNMRLEYFKSFWPKSHSRNLFIPFS